MNITITGSKWKMLKTLGFANQTRAADSLCLIFGPAQAIGMKLLGGPLTALASCTIIALAFQTSIGTRAGGIKE